MGNNGPGAVSPVGGDCPECGGTVRNTGTEAVCCACDTVVEDRPMDHGPEWRPFDVYVDDTDAERTGPPRTVTRHDDGLGATMSFAPREMAEARRRLFNRLRRRNKRSKLSKSDRNIVYCLTEIDRMTAAMGLSKSVEEAACVLVRRAQSEGLFPGRTLEGMAAASVYAACRVRGLPRTAGDVATVARCSEEAVSHYYGVLNRSLGLPAPPTPPAEYVPRLVDAVCDGDEEATPGDAASADDADHRLRERATELAADAADALVGRNPAGVAAGCVYAAAVEQDRAGDDVTQEALADAADVTPVTLRNAYYHVLGDDGDGSEG